MRAVVILVALTTVAFLVPQAQMSPQTGDERSTTARGQGLGQVQISGFAGMGDEGLVLAGNVGAETFHFPGAPRVEDPPILPDWPWELPEMWADAPPQVDQTTPQIPLSDLVAAAARAPDSALPERSYTRNHRRITANSLNMRTGPAKRFPAVLALEIGDVVEITGPPENGWVPVRTEPSGTPGWVFFRYLKPL